MLYYYTKMKTKHEKHVTEAEVMQSNMVEMAKIFKSNPDKYDVIAFDLQQAFPISHLQVRPVFYQR